MHDEPLKIPGIEGGGVQGLQQQLCPCNSEPHCFWIYTFLNENMLTAVSSQTTQSEQATLPGHVIHAPCIPRFRNMHEKQAVLGQNHMCLDGRAMLVEFGKSGAGRVAVKRSPALTQDCLDHNRVDH
jgi:hypothetical protein